MKIKRKVMDFEQVSALPKSEHKEPKVPKRFVGKLLKTLSAGELKKVHFKCDRVGMEKLGEDQAALVLMNHSSFIDLKIASTLLYPKPFSIVCTSDGFVGKEALMRMIGCIPTQKFVTDLALVKDIKDLILKKNCSVLMYPEASYSFDGTATPLPESLGKLIKMMKCPVVMIRTFGAFQRDPLYNNLQIRDTDVTARMTYLFTPEELMEKSADEINEILRQEFSFDHFRWQRDNHVRISEPFRADDLQRALYKCPHCLSEEAMEGKGTMITCKKCGASYELSEYGALIYQGNPLDAKFDHIPDWYKWQRDCVRKEIEEGMYKLDLPVDILVLKDTKAVYQVGEGRLLHDANGFVLDGCEGKLHYVQSPLASYSLYSDFYWYEIGDMICIGDSKILFYCFPKNGENVVAKARIAAECLYQMKYDADKRKRKRNK